MVKNQTYLNKVNYSGFFSYKLLNIDDIIQVENIVSRFEEKEKNINFNGLKYSLFNLSSKLSLSLSEKLKKIIDEYCGREFKGIYITESGILAAAHLAGQGNVKKFFKRGREFKDGFGTSMTSYLGNFSGYQLDLN